MEQLAHAALFVFVSIDLAGLTKQQQQLQGRQQQRAGQLIVCAWIIMSHACTKEATMSSNEIAASELAIAITGANTRRDTNIFLRASSELNLF